MRIFGSEINSFNFISITSITLLTSQFSETYKITKFGSAFENRQTASIRQSSQNLEVEPPPCSTMYTYSLGIFEIFSL